MVIDKPVKFKFQEALIIVEKSSDANFFHYCARESNEVISSNVDHFGDEGLSLTWENGC